MKRSLARLSVIVITAGATAVGIACSSSESHPRNTGDNPGQSNPGQGGSSDSGLDGEAGSSPDAAASGLTCSPADGGGGCNTLGFCTAQIHVVENKGLPPSMYGGPVPSGLYALTAYVYYSGGVDGGAAVSSSQYFQQTMRFTAQSADGGTADASALDGATDAASDQDAGASTLVDWQNYVADNDYPDPRTQNGVVTFSGNTLKIDTSCPTTASNIFSAQYTNSGNSLQMLTNDSKGSSVLTFTRVGP